MDQCENEAEQSSLGVWLVPTGSNESTEINLAAGAATVVVGANGSGKSALGWWLASHQPPGVSVLRMPAHRQLWFGSPGLDLSPQSAAQKRNFVAQSASDPSSRHMDHFQGVDVSLVMYDLLLREQSINSVATEVIREMIRETPGETIPKTALKEAVPEGVLQSMARILMSAGFRKVLTVNERQEFWLSTVGGGPYYPLSHASDGEKSAMVLAVAALTRPPGSALIIDEPERHLHRSIAPGLIAGLLTERSDCHVVLLTHDLDLAAALTGATTYVVDEARWPESTGVTNNVPEAWTLRKIPPASTIPESTRRGILGGRRQVLFVEGDAASLDVRLHRILFHDWEVLPVGSCLSVIRSVAGIRDTASLNWVEARGLIDRDGRTDEEIQELRTRGVDTLPMHEIESLLFSSAVRSVVAARRDEAQGLDPGTLNGRAEGRALALLGQAGKKEKLIMAVTKQILSRRQGSALGELPDERVKSATVTLEVASPYQDRLAVYGLIPIEGVVGV